MCTILDAAEERGVNRGETLKLIMMVQKKIKKGDSIAKIADGLVEDEIVISPIYKMVKEYPEDTERGMEQRGTGGVAQSGCRPSGGGRVGVGAGAAGLNSCNMQIGSPLAQLIKIVSRCGGGTKAETGHGGAHQMF